MFLLPYIFRIWLTCTSVISVFSCSILKHYKTFCNDSFLHKIISHSIRKSKVYTYSIKPCKCTSFNDYDSKRWSSQTILWYTNTEILLMLLYIYYTHRLSNTVRIQTRQEVKSRVLSTSHFHQSDPARKWSASQFLLIVALLNTDLCSLDVMPSSVFKMSSSNSVIISPDICSRANTSVYCVRSIASNKALT